MKRHFLAGLLMLGTLATTVQADMYKCPNGKGGVVFQDIPCTGEGIQLSLPTGSTMGYTPPPVGSSPDQKAERRMQWGELCKDMGEVAAVMAKGRDQGIPVSKCLELIEETRRKQGGEFQGFLTQMFRNMVLQVYDKTWWTPPMAQQRIEVTCVKEMEQQLQR